MNRSHIADWLRRQGRYKVELVAMIAAALLLVLAAFGVFLLTNR